jgi:hypothetical protein
MFGVNEQVIQRFRFWLRRHTESLNWKKSGRKPNWTFSGRSADTENQRAGTWTERDFGLSENVESPCPFHAHARSASVDMDCPRTVRVCCANCCMVCCVRVALEVAWMFHACCADCCVTCFADFTGNCPDIYQPLRGHSSLLREMFPGNCSDTTRQLPGCFAGRCATCQPSASCLRRGPLPHLPTQC